MYFPYHGNFHIFLEDPYLLQVDSATKMYKTNSADLNDFSNFHSLYFSVEKHSDVGKLVRKKCGKFPRGGKLRAFTVLQEHYSKSSCDFFCSIVERWRIWQPWPLRTTTRPWFPSSPPTATCSRRRCTKPGPSCLPRRPTFCWTWAAT